MASIDEYTFPSSPTSFIIMSNNNHKKVTSKNNKKDENKTSKVGTITNVYRAPQIVDETPIKIMVHCREYKKQKPAIDTNTLYMLEPEKPFTFGDRWDHVSDQIGTLINRHADFLLDGCVFDRSKIMAGSAFYGRKKRNGDNTNNVTSPSLIGINSQDNYQAILIESGVVKVKAASTVTRNKNTKYPIIDFVEIQLCVMNSGNI